MADDWEEIRRLAADLQRAQLSGTIQKLSERNCIEIVTRLIKSQAIEVIYTNDGKEYLTPQHLQREITDELYVARGRISLVELAQTLNVDFSHVEAQAQHLAKQDSRVSLVLGQLITSDYLDTISEEINENLQLNGTVTIGKITKNYDLPSEFLQEEITKRLGSIIEGFQDERDPKTILTTSFVMRNKAKIRGALSAVTVPTPVSSIINRFHITEQLFFSLAEELIKTHRLAGNLSGGRKANKATYTPNVYSFAQLRWVDDFMAQNGYIEYESVARLGITEPQTFIKKRFKDGDLHFLSTCAIGNSVFEAVESSVEEAVNASSWLDVTSLLPSVLDGEDVRQVLHKITSKKGGRKGCSVFADTVVMTNELMSKLEETFTDLIESQAKKDVQNKKHEKVFTNVGGTIDKAEIIDTKVDKKDERRKKAASGKVGGGTQGRETKTKAVKKKYGKGKKNKDDDWDDDSGDEGSEISNAKKNEPSSAKVEFMTMKELEKKISQITLLLDCKEEAFAELARYFYPILNGKYYKLLQDLYQSSLVASMHDKRKSHAELQERCNTLISHIRLFEKGLSSFEGNDRKTLEKHLLKTLCTDLTNAVFSHLNDDGCPEENFTPEKRLKVITKVSKSEGEALLAIHKALAGDDVAEFLDSFEEKSSAAADLFIRKVDKKKDRNLVHAHKMSLIEQLKQSDDPALILHLAVLILFQIQTGNMLHASGKFVPTILDKISGNLSQDDSAILKSYQELVIEKMSNNEESSEALNELTDKVKSMVFNAKKPKAEEGE